MNKWLPVSVCFSLAIVTPIKAVDKVAIINMNSLFQNVAHKTGVSAALEKEFLVRTKELQYMENDLQNKIQYLHRDGPNMEPSERSKLEKEVVNQRQAFAKKAQSFEQDRQRRSNEEHGKLVSRIQTAVEKVAYKDNIDLVIDTNSIAFNGKNIKDITADVLKQVK